MYETSTASAHTILSAFLVSEIIASCLMKIRQRNDELKSVHSRKSETPKANDIAHNKNRQAGPYTSTVSLKIAYVKRVGAVFDDTHMATNVNWMFLRSAESIAVHTSMVQRQTVYNG